MPKRVAAEWERNSPEMRADDLVNRSGGLDIGSPSEHWMEVSLHCRKEL